MNGFMIGIAGETAAGKTTLRCGLSNNTTAFARATRDPLLAYATDHQLPTDKAGLQRVWTELARQRGDDVIWQLLRDEVMDRPEPVIIIEGLRLLTDLAQIDELSRVLGRELLVVYLHAEPAVRFKRHNQRLQKDGQRPLTRQQFGELESHECEAQLVDLMLAVEEMDHGLVIDTTATTPGKTLELTLHRLVPALTG